MEKLHSTCQPIRVLGVFLTLTEKHPSASVKPVINQGLIPLDSLLRVEEEEAKRVNKNHLDFKYSFTLFIWSQAEFECTNNFDNLHYQLDYVFLLLFIILKLILINKRSLMPFFYFD